MKNKLIFFATLLLACTLGYAKEPGNLATLKDQIIAYHDSGEYERDITKISREALAFVNSHFSKFKKPAIVFDIDETTLSNYQALRDLNFGGTLKDIQAKELLGNDPAIKPMLSLYQYAKDHHVAIFFVTGRPEIERAATMRNLREAGYSNWKALYLKPKSLAQKSAAIYKAAIRKKLTESGYTILANIGDQESDLTGGYAMKTFKLPNPFYLIP